MRRSILALAFAVLGAAATASATCDDTLYLQSITVFRQTLKNSTTLGTWDTVVVNPWSLSDLQNAGPLGYSVSGFHADTARHYLRFSSNCGADSMSPVLVARVRDSLVATDSLQPHHFSADTSSTSLQVERIGDGVSTITLTGSNADYTLDYYWSSSVFQIGRLQGATTVEGWAGLVRSYTFTSANISSHGLLAAINPVKQIAVDNLNTFLSGQASAVASVGHGTDSVRTDLLMYRYLYAHGSPMTSLRPREEAFRAVSARSIGDGVEIRLATPAAVQILSPNGRVARILPAAAAQTWDGKDAYGRKLSGVWIVRAEGVGAVPVLVK